MNNPSKLLVVVGQAEDTLHPEIDWDHLKDSLQVETYCICSEAECVAAELNEVQYVIQFPDFERSYEWTCDAAAVQWNAPPVFLVTPENGLFSLQYNKQICTNLPAEAIPHTINAWLHEEKEEERLVQCAVTFAAVMFALFVLLLRSIGDAFAASSF